MSDVTVILILCALGAIVYAVAHAVIEATVFSGDKSADKPSAGDIEQPDCAHDKCALCDPTKTGPCPAHAHSVRSAYLDTQSEGGS